MSVKSYFDLHSHHHAYHKDPEYYSPIIDFIKKTNNGKKQQILDFGCGNGMFIKQLIKGGITADFLAIDVSSSMINLAKKNLKDENVEFVVADGFNVPLREGYGFDSIHLDMVLHHMVGNTRSQSFSLAQKLLDVVASLLSNKGQVIIEEWNYGSYISPSITASIIFYTLRFLNSLHLDVSKIASEIQPGLLVNFFNRENLERLLKTYGTIKLIREIDFPVAFRRRFILLKELSNVSYSVQFKKENLS